MTLRLLLIPAAATLTAVFFFASAGAQGFRLGNWGGSLEGLVDFDRQHTETGGSQKSTVERTRTEEKLTLRNTGAYIFDPRLVTFSLGGTFGLSQERSTTDDIDLSREGTLGGYDAFATIFSERNTSLNLFSNWNKSIESRELAGQTDILSQNMGGSLFLRGLYIPSTLSFRQEYRKDESRTGTFVSRREDRRNTFTYEGQRGWVDSELDARYEFVDLSDKVFPNLGFESHEGNLNYSLDFGTELNWHWDSRLRGFKRTGVADLTTLNLNELLRIDHSERLGTAYRYFLTDTDTPGGETTTQTLGFSLDHRLYESLNTALGLDATFEDLPGGNKDILDSRLDFAYNKRLPREGLLTAGLGGSLKYEDNEFAVTETFVSQETHTAATPFALPIDLRNPFVVTSSVVVTKMAVGPLPAGCLPAPGPPTPLVLGRDYTLSAAGDITNIVPVPCSGIAPGINPGDTIAVDYSFTVSPSLTFTTKTWRANLSVNYGWIRPFFFHEQTEQDYISGRDSQFLEDRRSDTLGVELRYDGQRLRGSLVAEGERLKSRRQAYDTFRLRQFLGMTILPQLRLTVNASETFSEFSRPRRQSRTILAGGPTLTYAFRASLFAEAFARVDYLRDTLIPTERTLETGLRARWLFRKLEVSPTLEFFDRKRGDTDTEEYRVILRIVRRF